MLTQTRTPHAEAITSSQGAHANQLRRSQKVGVSKTKTIQQVDNETGLPSPEDKAAFGLQYAQQLFQQQPQQLFGAPEEKRAFRRGPRGAAPFNGVGGMRTHNRPMANQNFNRYFR